jgi:tRNA-specific 2-thiouridylase
LGRLTKSEVRSIARRRGLPVAEQAASHDICFLHGADYRAFLATHAPHLSRPGPIRDACCRVIGEHQGLPAYTIGQRKGLGIASAEPLYVLAIDSPDNALIVGPAEELDRSECTLEQVHYVSRPAPSARFRAAGQIRYRAVPAPVIVDPMPEQGARVRFASPQRSVAPGQFLVFYDGDTVLGGGAIASVRLFAPAPPPCVRRAIDNTCGLRLAVL